MKHAFAEAARDPRELKENLVGGLEFVPDYGGTIGILLGFKLEEAAIQAEGKAAWTRAIVCSA